MKKNVLVVLPFLALLILGVTESVSSTYVALSSWFPYVGYALAFGCVAGWFYGDREFFKHFLSRKGFRYGASSGALVLLVIASLVGFAYLTSRDTFNKKWDVTKNKVSSLSEASLEVAAKIGERDEGIKARGFFSNPDELAEFRRLIGLYVLHGASIDVEYINPGQNPEAVMAAEIKSENTVIFDLGERNSRITSFTEEEITNVLLNLLKSGTKNVYFTKGHGEAGTDSTERSGFSLAKDILDDQKIEVAEVSLLDAGMIADDADLVVIAGPQYDFQPGEIQLLEEYLQGGGAVVLAVNSVTPLPQLNDFAQKYGLLINNDVLLLDGRDPRSRLMGQNYALVTDFDSRHSITKKFSEDSGAGAQMLWEASRSVELLKDAEGDLNKPEEGYQTALIMKTAPYVVRVTDVNSAQDLQNLSQDRISQGGTYGVLAISTLDAPDNVESSAEESSEGHVSGEEEEASGEEQDGTEVSSSEDESDGILDTESQRGGTLVVAGSVGFMTNSGLQMSGAHRDLTGSLVSYLVRDESFVSIASKQFDSGNLDLSSDSAQLTLFFSKWVYPALLLGLTLLYWLYRRRKAA